MKKFLFLIALGACATETPPEGTGTDLEDLQHGRYRGWVEGPQGRTDFLDLRVLESPVSDLSLLWGGAVGDFLVPSCRLEGAWTTGHVEFLPVVCADGETAVSGTGEFFENNFQANVRVLQNGETSEWTVYGVLEGL